MATMTISIVSALGTNTTTLTFSAPDAQRIFTAYKNQFNQAATQADMAQFFAQQANKLLNQMVVQNEISTPIAPAIAVANS